MTNDLSGAPRPDADSWQRLSESFAKGGGITAAFSTKVVDYLAARPGYPRALLEHLAGLPGLDSSCSGGGAHIADLGSGTGLLSAGLLDLDQGLRVSAVEPNAEMRAAAEQLLGGRAGFRSLAGQAEAIPLPDASVDLLTAAQAFHWFEIEAARREALRVLRPQGQVALIWNDRLADDPLQQELDLLFDEFGGASRQAQKLHLAKAGPVAGSRPPSEEEEERAGLARFFGGARPQRLHWPHQQSLDLAGLLSLAFSRSYLPPRATAQGRALAQRLGELFQREAKDGLVQLHYRTLALIARPQA